MFTYTAYGLCIQSVLQLPELVAVEAAPDVVIRLGRVGHMPPVVAAEGCSLWATPKEARLFYQQIGSVIVRNGREMVVEPAAGVDERVLRLVILGPALAMLLHQRNLLVLHANTVSINGGAVVFLGRTGQGKSTIAAALYSRAHGIVSDDVTAIRVGNTSPAAYPGFPRLKLWPETAASMGDDLEKLPRLRPWLEKRDRRTVRGFPKTSLPLKRIYVLMDGTRQEIAPLRPHEAIMALVRNSYPVVANLLKATGTTISHFQQCAELSGCVSIVSLKSQRSLSAVPDLARLVEEDLAQCLA